MTKYRRKAEADIKAVQWHKNGATPFDDAPLPLVRPFRCADILGSQVCPHCGTTAHDHGWIDSGDGYVVCPGDWVITDHAGNHRIMKPDMFTAVYERVHE